MSRFIVIEGTDCSGKSTQIKLLQDRLEREKIKFAVISFPRYQDQSSVLVRMYLEGEMGNNPSDVNAFAASTFFAVDRYVFYKNNWNDFSHCGIILTDRYTTSNAIHQASKLEGCERNRYLEWLFDFEYNLLELPVPDEIIFLDMPPEFSSHLMSKRGGKEKDIHESDAKYLKKCYNTASEICKEYGWIKISCIENNRIRTIEDIHNEIFEKIVGEK